MKKHIVSFIVALIAVAYVTQAQTPTAVGDKQSGLAAVYSDSLNGHTTAWSEVRPGQNDGGAQDTAFRYQNQSDEHEEHDEICAAAGGHSKSRMTLVL